MDKFRVAMMTPRRAGTLTREIIYIIKTAINKKQWKIAIIVYGKEYSDGYAAGLKTIRPKFIIDEWG